MAQQNSNTGATAIAVSTLSAILNGEDYGSFGAADILIAANINDAQAEKYLRLGLPMVFRTLAGQEKLNELSEKLKEKKDQYRLGRVSQNGATRIADSGNLRWGRDGRKYLIPWSAFKDLLNMGYKVVVLEIFKRQGDKTSKFRIGLSARADATPIAMEEGWPEAIREVTKHLFYQGWVYYNDQIASLASENNPMQAPLVTVNLTGTVDSRKLAEIQGQIREIHVGFGGSLTTTPVKK